MSRASAIMVQGCTSWAGKSWLATALCRWYRRQGVDVAPFKAQNMANNARVVDRRGGGAGEIGVAQWLQAKAAGVVPDTRMNPVLVKPESLTSSQVVVDGVVDPDLSRLEWSARAPLLRQRMHAAYDDLAAQHALVVLEGAGSPAEVNLDDQVNMAMADHADAAVLLVVDIDRGGAFAHLYGTWALLPEHQRARVRGFVLNRFRGDPSLLAPGPERLQELTGVPTIGVIPMIVHDLPDEDGAARHLPALAGTPRVGIVRAPTASNLDEFVRLEQVAEVRWVTHPADLDSLDLVVLPGSKHVLGDAAWLTSTGVGDAIVVAARSGVRILGICGGLQLLGRSVTDPHGVDGGRAGASSDGLGLLDAVTTMADTKTVMRTPVHFDDLPAPWFELRGRSFAGYEIRHGTVEAARDSVARGTLAACDGNVLGILAHGMFEDDDILEALLGSRPTATLDQTFEQLADVVDEHIDTDMLRSLTPDLGRQSAAPAEPKGL